MVSWALSGEPRVALGCPWELDLTATPPRPLTSWKQAQPAVYCPAPNPSSVRPSPVWGRAASPRASFEQEAQLFWVLGAGALTPQSRRD